MTTEEFAKTWEIHRGASAADSWVLRYIADRDARNLDYTDELNAAIDSYPRTLAAWDALAEVLNPIAYAWGRLPPPLVMEGRAILRFKATAAEAATTPAPAAPEQDK